MIPMKHYEQFVGKVVTLGSDVGCLDALFGRLREIDGEILIFDSVTKGTLIVDASLVVRVTAGPSEDKTFTDRLDRQSADDADSPISALAALLGRSRGITVPPDTQADIDAMLADDAA